METRLLVGGILALSITLLGVGPESFTQNRPKTVDPAEDFIDSRPHGKSSARLRKKAIYRSELPDVAKHPAAPSDLNAEIGITLWRLRPSRSADRGARLLVHEKKESPEVEMTLERIPAQLRLSEGDFVRLTVESPHAGYLYLIDRERLADGTTGDPYLIFPTTRTRGGDNVATPGRLIEIPARDDNPPYFTLRRSQPDQVSEALTLLITRQPIAEVQIGSEPVKLSKEQVDLWEKKWGGPAERFNLVGGVGEEWTKEEKAAGAAGGRQLVQNDPLPQTIYRVRARPGDPLLVTISLQIGDKASTGRTSGPVEDSVGPNAPYRLHQVSLTEAL